MNIKQINSPISALNNIETKIHFLDKNLNDTEEKHKKVLKNKTLCKGDIVTINENIFIIYRNNMLDDAHCIDIFELLEKLKNICIAKQITKN